MDLSAPLKFQRWKDSVTCTKAGEEIPNPPTILLQDFSTANQLKIKSYYHTRGWENCSNDACNRTGTDFKMKACSGCNNPPEGRFLYCSRACQRADWPMHKSYCHRKPVKEIIERVAESEISSVVTSNCLKRARKRREGLRTISAWLFKSIYTEYPDINLHEMTLSVFCHSSDRGKGMIVPVEYRLEPTVDTELQQANIQFLTDNHKRKAGIVQIWVDMVYHCPIYVAVDTDVGIDTVAAQPFWPWIFATIVRMGNTNLQLADSRLLCLVVVVATLARHNWPRLHRFKGPRNFDNGEPWALYDFQEWQAIFGHVIGF